MSPEVEEITVRSALTKTGGFLYAYTHTLQPYVGCAFGRGCGVYCYVAESPVHKFQSDGRAWGDYVRIKTNVAELLREELTRHSRQHRLDELRVFMSSSTDPYQGIEAKTQATRACLKAFAERPPGVLVVQTRSPLVERDFDLLAALGPRAWLSVTIESDDDKMRRALTPGTPSFARRRQIVERAQTAGLNVQVAVAPYLPIKDTDAFAGWLAEWADRVVVDTFVSGDGNDGARTARSALPQQFADTGLGDWRDETSARTLVERLRGIFGSEHVGWSAAGFNALCTDEVRWKLTACSQ